MEAYIPTPIRILLLTDQRTSSLCTLDNYNNLPLVAITWHTTTEDPFLLMITTMAYQELTVLKALHVMVLVTEVDGGFGTVHTVH